MLSYTLADAEINRKNNLRGPKGARSAECKINYCHVFCDWQMVSNPTNQD